MFLLYQLVAQHLLLIVELVQLLYLTLKYLKVLKVIQVILDHKEFKVNQDQSDQQDPKEFKVNQDQQDQQDPKVQLAQLGQGYRLLEVEIMKYSLVVRMVVRTHPGAKLRRIVWLIIASELRNL